MWKLQNFSVTQILREIKVGKFKVSKSVILAHFEALNFGLFYFLNFFTLQRLQFTKLTKIQSPKNGDNGIFRIARFSKNDFT